MRFLIDEQLPPRLVDWLRSQGHEADHVRALIAPQASDKRIVKLAAETGAVIVTKDADFHDLLNRSESGEQMIWIRIGNAVNRVLIGRLEVEWPRIERELTEGSRLVELE